MNAETVNNVLSSFLSFFVYLSAGILRAFKSTTARKATKRNSDVRKGLRYIQIAVTATLFCINVAHALCLSFKAKAAEQIGTIQQFGPSPTSELFSSLIWLLIMLNLTRLSSCIGIAETGAWVVSLVFAISNAILQSLRPIRDLSPLGYRDLLIQWTKVALILVLLVISAMSGDFQRSIGELLPSHQSGTCERQPLLGDLLREDSLSEQCSVHNDGSKSDHHAEDEDEDELDDGELDRQSLRQRNFWQYISSFKVFVPLVAPKTWQQYFLLLVTFANVLATRAVNLGLPLVYGSLIADLSHREFNMTRILLYVALRFAASRSGVYLIRDFATHRLSTQMRINLVNCCYNHLMDLSADYHLSKSSPDVWQILDRGRNVVELLSTIFLELLPVTLDLVIATGVVYRLFGPFLCFTVAATMITFLWANKVSLERRITLRRDFIKVWQEEYRHMCHSVFHWKTVSEFTNVNHEQHRHAKLSAVTHQQQLSARSFRLALDAGQEIVLTLGFLIVCLTAAYEMTTSSSPGDDVGKFVTLISYWGLIMDPIETLVSSANDITENLVEAEKLMLLLEKEPTIIDMPEAAPFTFRGGCVTFEDVSFAFPNNERLITRDVSFTILPGQTVAIVGETGGGKTTLFNLLYRFYDPSAGRVMVDGQDIRHVTLKSYRNMLGLVPQNPILFNYSIMENVRYSRPSSTDEQVIEACKSAQLHEKIMQFPKGYAQKVGELAQKLSGGELQRVAIARAILKDPKILLLDEATSAVDSVTESKIQESLDALSEGRTTFVIAHRLSTVINADLILVVKGGKVVEQGRHEELLERQDGAYKELWNAQLRVQNRLKPI